MIRSFAVAMLWLLAASSSFADEFFLKPGKVLFLGDSNTYAGTFVAYVDAYLAGRFPEQKYELINLGLPSETCTGLTEKDHPWPRPDVHERAQRALDKIKPNYVVVCYGMNDGIYAPFSEERFAKYKDGIQSLLAKIRKAGAQPILMTPCPFDELAVTKRPKGADGFSYRNPYEGYDEVLTKYSEWLVTLRSKDLPVADPHSAIVKVLAEERKQNPSYVISGDGIHPNATGHALVALTLLKSLNASAELGSIAIPRKTETATAEIKVPMPKGPSWIARLSDAKSIYQELNVLTIKGDVPAGETRSIKIDGAAVAVADSEQLAKGVSVDPTAVPIVRSAYAQLFDPVETRQMLLRDTWLSEVKHTRPGVQAGQPLEKVQPVLDDLDRRIRKAAQPIEAEVSLEPNAK